MQSFLFVKEEVAAAPKALFCRRRRRAAAFNTQAIRKIFSLKRGGDRRGKACLAMLAVVVVKSFLLLRPVGGRLLKMVMMIRRQAAHGRQSGVQHTRYVEMLGVRVMYIHGKKAGISAKIRQRAARA